MVKKRTGAISMTRRAPFSQLISNSLISYSKGKGEVSARRAESKYRAERQRSIAKPTTLNIAPLAYRNSEILNNKCTAFLGSVEEVVT